MAAVMPVIPAAEPADMPDHSSAESLSSATGLSLARSSKLLEEARGDFNLAISRGFKEQQHAAKPGEAAGEDEDEDEASTGARSKATLTILGGENVAYPRASGSILAQHIYLVLEVLGERQRTEAVRRSRRPRWAQASFALAELPAGEGAGSVRLTLCDLDHNVIGSGAANLPAENDSGGATVAVELLSAACDLPAECHGVAGTIELRIARDRADLPEAEAEAEEAPLERIRSCPVASASARHGGTELFTRQMLPVRFNLLGAGNDRLKRWCVCDGCHSLPQIDDASTELLVLRGCSHATCAHCLVTATTQALAAALDGSTDGIRVACPEPGCGGVVQPDEIYKGLPNHPILVEYAEESMDDTLGRILSADVTMVNCPQCASSFGMKPGTVGELTAAAKDVMRDATLGSLKDFAEHRVRCPGCSLEFCSGCQLAPFHFGAENCEAAKLASEACACRFCGEELVDPEEDGHVAGHYEAAARCVVRAGPELDSDQVLEAGATADGITRLRFVDGWVSERERVGRGLAGKYLVTKIEQGREWWEGTSIHDEEGWRSSGDEEAYRPSSVLKPDDSCWHSDTDEAEWLTFDLMESLEVSKIELTVGRAASRGWGFGSSAADAPRRFSVQQSTVSRDGPWQTVRNLEGKKTTDPQEHVIKPPPPPVPCALVLEALTGMGFSAEVATAAALKFESVETAVGWAFENPEPDGDAAAEPLVAFGGGAFAAFMGDADDESAAAAMDRDLSQEAIGTLATKLDNAKQTLELFQQMGEQDGIRQITVEIAELESAIADRELSQEASIEVGRRVTVEGFSDYPGDAVVAKLFADGSASVSYDDGSTWSRAAKDSLTIFVDAADADDAAGDDDDDRVEWICTSGNPREIALRSEATEKCRWFSGPVPGDMIVAAAAPITAENGWQYLRLKAPFKGRLGYVPYTFAEDKPHERRNRPLFKINQPPAELEEPTVAHDSAARFWRLQFHDNHGGESISIQHVKFQVMMTALKAVCLDPDCQDRAANACVRTRRCGHACTGVRCGVDRRCEDTCPAGCLHCAAKGVTPEAYERQLKALQRADAAMNAVTPRVMQGQKISAELGAYKELLDSQTNADEYCSLCYTEDLGSAPVLQLGCGHILHRHCLNAQLESKSSGSRIAFTFLECSLCRADLQHPQLDEALAPHLKLRDTVSRLAVAELTRNEGEGAQKLADEAGEALDAFARRKFVFKFCTDCDQPFCTGAIDCGGAEAAEADAGEAPADVICTSCVSMKGNVQSCEKHGVDHLMWKCRYCCNVAQFACFGYAHFCGTCHENPLLGELIDFKAKKVKGPLPYSSYPGEQYTNKKELDEYPECLGCEDGGEGCRLGMLHPRNGVEFCLGCSQCSVERGAVDRLLGMIRAMCGTPGDEHNYYNGYLARIKDLHDLASVNIEMDACMLEFGAAALAVGRLSLSDAISWLEKQGHTSWSTDETAEEKEAARIAALEKAGPQLLVNNGEPQKEVWEFEGDLGAGRGRRVSWEPFSDADQEALNAARAEGRTQLDLVAGRWTYSIDLMAMTQTNAQTGKVRRLRATRDEAVGKRVDFHAGDFGLGNVNVKGPLAFVVIDNDDAVLAKESLKETVAVCDRGGCSFVRKAILAQEAGAIGLIIVNCEAGELHMGGDGEEGKIQIPVVSVRRRDRGVFVDAAGVQAAQSLILNLQRHDGKVQRHDRKVPEQDEVVDAFLRLELPPVLREIYERPQRSAIKIQTMIRSVMRRQRFVRVKHTAVEIQRLVRGHLGRVEADSRRPMKVRHARIEALEDAQRSRRLALVVQECMVVSLEHALAEQEELRRALSASERQSEAFLAGSVAGSEVEEEEGEESGSGSGSGSDDDSDDPVAFLRARKVFGRGGAASKAHYPEQFSEYWRTVKAIAESKAGAGSISPEAAEPTDADLEAAMDLFEAEADGLAVPLRRGSMSERLGSWMDQRRLSRSSSSGSVGSAASLYDEQEGSGAGEWYDMFDLGALRAAQQERRGSRGALNVCDNAPTTV